MNVFDLPQVQSGVIPFVVSLVVYLLLVKRWPEWSALGALAGFYFGAASMGVLDLAPTRSANKIFLVGLGFVILGIVFDAVAANASNSERKHRFTVLALVVLMLSAVGWLIFKPVSRQDGFEIVLSLGLSAIWTAWVAGWILSLKSQPIRAYVVTTFLALAIGICTAIGASVLLGQLSIGLGVACGAILLVACFSNVTKVAYKYLAPVIILCVCIGVAGVIYAKVSWLTLLILAIIPLVARLPIPVAWPRLAQASLASLYVVLCASTAVFLTWWQSVQSSSYY